MNQELATIEPAGELAVRLPRLDVAAIQARVADIERVIDTLMREGTHYGPAFPGSDKHALLQPGAELLLEAFGLVPRPQITEIELPGQHKRFVVTGSVELPNGRSVGEMEAECSTLEPKYRYRNAGIVCPSCGQETVLKSKPRGNQPMPAEGLGWFCWAKKGGCGAQFPPGDESIAGQRPGRVENPDPAELYHTCKMMAQKRWMVNITKRTFALSGRFIDPEAVKFSGFDWTKAAPLLRAIPGEKREKWNRVIVHALKEFGKPPEELTVLEGSVVLDWLASQVTAAPDLRPEDFMLSPESGRVARDLAVGLSTGREDPPPPNGGAAKPLPPSETKAFEKELQRVGAFDDFVAQHGPPTSWTTETHGAIVVAIRAAKEAKA